MKRRTGAARIVGLFGGIRKFARLYADEFGKMDASTPAKWIARGSIPNWRRGPILQLAKKHRLSLAEADFG